MGDFFDFIDPVEDNGVVIFIIGFDEGTAPTLAAGDDFLVWQRSLTQSTDIDLYSWQTSGTGEEDAACRGALAFALDGSGEVTGSALALPDGETAGFTPGTGAEQMEFMELWGDFF